MSNSEASCRGVVAEYNLIKYRDAILVSLAKNRASLSITALNIGSGAVTEKSRELSLIEHSGQQKGSEDATHL